MQHAGTNCDSREHANITAGLGNTCTHTVYFCAIFNSNIACRSITRVHVDYLFFNWPCLWCMQAILFYGKHLHVKRLTVKLEIAKQ